MIQSRDVAAEMLSRIRRVTIILNPEAGRGAARHERENLESMFARAIRNLHDLVSWTVVETTGPGSATILAREAARNGVQIVVAAGGDGTINEVVNGLVGTDVKLGIVPLGTGNDFARTIGCGLTIKEAVLSIFYGDPIRVDLGKLNDRYFINVAGCGFDSEVAHRVNSSNSRLRGRAAYIAAVYHSLKDFAPVNMELTLDSERHEMNGMLCAVANARHYGGGMMIAPEALLNDGLFDVCVVCAGKWEFLKSFPRVFKGTHISHPDVHILQASHVTVRTDRPVPVMLDGEILGETPAEFSLVPEAISVLGPERERDSTGEEFGYIAPKR